MKKSAAWITLSQQNITTVMHAPLEEFLEEHPESYYSLVRRRNKKYSVVRGRRNKKKSA